MQIKLSKEQIPWAMAAGRGLLGPVLIAGDACGWSGLAMAWLVVTALVSDIFDGVLARRWHCDTAGVRLFDSMADTVFYVCAAIALWIRVPQVWLQNEGLWVALLGLEAVRFGLDFAKFGKPASYHSYLAKAWGLVLAIAVVAVFASGRASLLIPVALTLGIACDLEGLAMSLVLPVWCKDVKTLRAAWLLRSRIRPGIETNSLANGIESQAHPSAGKATWAAVICTLLAWGLLAVPAGALQPGQAAYAGGTAEIGQDTIGILDTSSPAALIFRFKKMDGTPGEIDIDYKDIRRFQSSNELRHRLGVLPAIAVGLMAARQRRYLLTITYGGETDAAQIAIFEMSKRDQSELISILSARDPHSCHTPMSGYGTRRCRQ